MTTTFTDSKNNISCSTDLALGDVVDAQLGDKTVRGRVVAFQFGRRAFIVQLSSINGEGNPQGVAVEIEDVRLVAPQAGLGASGT